jgi:signal recognition particle subunit SRP54
MLEGIRSSFQSVFDKIRGGGKLTEDNLRDAVRMIRRALIEADVAAGVAKEFANDVRDKAVGQELIGKIRPEQQFVKIVNDELVAMMAPVGEDESKLTLQSSRPTVIMLCGLNGAGKTTTAGKLALHMRKKMKKEPLLVAADLARPAAIEQLKMIGGSLDVPVHFTDDPKGTTPPKLCKEAIRRAEKEGHEVVILDTAGRLQIDEPLMAELEAVKKRSKPDYTLLVLDGMTGQDAANSAKVFDDRLNTDGAILTKMDGDARGGAALSVRKITGKPIRFMGVGEKPGDFEEFRAEGMASRILAMGDIVSLVEDAQHVIKQEEAEAQLERLLLDQFTYDDYLNQLAAVEKMGSFKSLLEKMPTGMLGLPKDALDQVDESELKYVKAIIQSMTAKERQRPDLIAKDASRRRRVARGSGRDVAQVNDLIKSFDMIRKQFQAMAEGEQGMLGKFAAGRIKSQKKKQFRQAKKQKKRRGKDKSRRR